MLSSSDGKDCNNKRIDERPDEPGHGVEVVAKELHAETGWVVDCDVVSEHREDEENQAELGEWERMERLSEETAKTVIGVCIW